MEKPHISKLIFKRLSAGGSADMAVDGSSTAVKFKWTSPVGKAAEIMRINFVIVDGGIGYGEFGGLGSALTNGLLVQVFDVNDNELVDFLDGNPIKTNEQFGYLAGADAISLPAAGDDSFHVRWTLSKAANQSIALDAGDYIQVTVRDNLSALSDFGAMIQGFYRD